MQPAGAVPLGGAPGLPPGRGGGKGCRGAAPPCPARPSPLASLGWSPASRHTHDKDREKTTPLGLMAEPPLLARLPQPRGVPGRSPASSRGSAVPTRFWDEFEGAARSGVRQGNGARELCEVSWAPRGPFLPPDPCPARACALGGWGDPEPRGVPESVSAAHSSVPQLSEVFLFCLRL